jgi:hypothetical protein
MLALVIAIVGLLMLVVPAPFVYVAVRGGAALNTERSPRRREGGHGDAIVRVLGTLALIAAFLLALAYG